MFKKISRPVRHLLYWLVPYMAIMLLQYAYSEKGNYDWVLDVSIAFAVAACIIYTNIFLCRKFFFGKRIFYFAGIAALYVVYIVFVFAATDPQAVNRITDTPAKSFTIGFFFTLYFLVLLLLSFVYWAVTIANKRNKELLAAQIKLQQFEHDKNHAEKKFLQSQINPHFLYNTLNYFYSKSITVSPELADSILLLSDIMRYSLDLKENENGLVLLQKEVEHIKNMIKINQYRFSNRLQIRFLISGKLNAVCIAPLILITFVENTFKHAELTDPQHPVVLKLDVSQQDQHISFSVHNKIKKGPREHGTGIGISNVTGRLNFIYGDKYTLQISDKPDFYNASLILPLYSDVTL